MSWYAFDVPRKEAEIKSLEIESALSSFWDDPKDAQRKMRQLARLRDSVQLWRELEARIASARELTDLAIEDGDSSLEEPLRAEAEELSHTLDREALQLTLSGPYDERSAILSIHAGAGGTESQDWAEMLLRMYLRWAENSRFKTQILDVSYGEEAGVKGVAVEIAGHYAFGYLKAEKGVHRLVRLSPFDANHLRHTSFAQVEVLPAAEEDPEITVTPDDIKIEFYRASGPGGQNVQKVASAVRISHLETGIVVTCQNERSQYQNREFAMKILFARLLERQVQRKAAEIAQLKGERVSAEWGNQIRSYVLHPYKLVKDHRTNYQTNEPEKVLDGDLDDYIKAYLMSTVGEG